MTRRETLGGTAWPRGNSRRIAWGAAILAATALVAGCSATSQPRSGTSLGFAGQGEAIRTQLTAIATPANYRVGKPYKIAGRWYHPEEDPGYDEVGLASWYGDDFHGRKTASGEIYDMHALTAAHPTLPMPTYARVTNLENGRSVVVRINDRGPFSNGRVIDLSKHTARTLGFKHNGTAEVRVQYVGAAVAEASDDWLTTTVRDDGQPVGPTMVAGSTEQLPADTQSADPSPRGEAVEPQALTLASGYAPIAGNTNRIAATFDLFDGQAGPHAHSAMAVMSRARRPAF